MGSYCRGYYDSSVFGSSLGNTLLDMNTGRDVDVAAVIKDMLSLADKWTIGSSVEAFRQEVRALHLELYGLAWCQGIADGEPAVSQSIFTKEFLADYGEPNLWALMGEYNRILVMSTNLDADGERLPQSEVTRFNLERMEFYQHWAEIVCSDPENPTNEEKSQLNCVARVANRNRVDLKKNEGFAARMLSAKMLDRLGWVDRVHQDASGILHHTVHVLYTDCETNLNNLEL